ncbi:cell adhesion molecule Dscam2-like [Ornithodoros turicata]|uniref:cell adhesion molecule Dscam2-like n=1 Tax=Ornithodoros turicata TaxID=34597 RepID=UPI0031395131
MAAHFVVLWLGLSLFKNEGECTSALLLRGPSFVLEPSTVVEFASATGAVLPCSAQGQPEPKVSWERKDGIQATHIPGLRETRSDGSLLLVPFSASQYRQDVHSATYRCVATNSVGTIKSRYSHVQASTQM